MRIKTTYRNVYSGATFSVHGEEAAERMDALKSWKRVRR